MDGNDDLPDEFDVIVVGTGMVESIIAASVSRIGKTVLHLDSNMYYGDLWATLGLESLEEFAAAYDKPKEEIKPVAELEPNCSLFKMKSISPITQLAYKWFIPSTLPNVKDDIDYSKKTDDNEDKSNSSNQDPQIDNTSESNTKIGDNVLNDTKQANLDTESQLEDKEDSSTDDKGEAQTLLETQAMGDKTHNQDKEKVIEKAEVKKWSIHLLKQQSRKFNIDLAPKVIYSGGSMVELLLRSCVHRYTEFQSVSKILTYMESSGVLDEVPCTKSQVFSCKTFSIVDKRILMKAINFCVNFDSTNEPQFEELKDKMFVEVLKSKNIPEHLVQYVLHSVAMGTKTISMIDGSSRIKLFFNNVGRYGHSPFLWPLYGSGELLQAFCRLSAVYGGVYYLGRGVEAVLVSQEEKKCIGVLSSSKKIKAKHVISSSYSCPKEFLKENQSSPLFISRTILFTDRPLQEKGATNVKDSIVILHMPCKDDSNTSPIEVVQLPAMTGACPKQMYVIQITCEQKKPSWNEVREVIDKLFMINSKKTADPDSLLHEDPLLEQLISKLVDSDLKEWLCVEKDQNFEEGINQIEEGSDKPRILFAFHYNLMNSEHIGFNDSKPDNLYFCNGPDASIDFERAVKQAKEMFAQMYPDEEFLEPTPDPNDVSLSDLMGECAITAQEKQQSEEDKTKPDETPNVEVKTEVKESEDETQVINESSPKEKTANV